METGHTRYATGIFTSTMKTHKKFSQIRTSCSPSNPARSSHSPSASARPATSSNSSRRVATRHALAAFCLNRWNAAVFEPSGKSPIDLLLLLSRKQIHIPHQEYSLTRIFLLGYTRDMKTLWTALTEPNRFRMVELLRD